LSVCPNKGCGKMKPPHAVCPHCGFYGGELIVPRKEKKQKRGEQPAQDKDQEKK